MNHRRHRQQRRSRRPGQIHKQDMADLQKTNNDDEPDQHSDDLELTEGEQEPESSTTEEEHADMGSLPRTSKISNNETDLSHQEPQEAAIVTRPPTAAKPQPSPEPEAEKLAPPGQPPMPILDGSTIYSGDILREVREHRGISLKTISNITRIGVPSFIAIEEERYEDLPNARIYILGFVRCLANEIGLDSEACSKSYIARWQSWWDNRSDEDRKSYR